MAEKKRKRTKMRFPPAGNAIQFKIALAYISPSIWRQVVLPDNCTLGNLHEVIQIVMGWHNCHMHRFEIDGVSYTSAQMAEEDEMGMEDESTVFLSRIVKEPKQKFLYEYDFGDSWFHEITVEKIFPADAPHKNPVCLAGKRACPPEDCGSYPGYEELLKALKAKRKTADQKDMLEWLGEDYDPEHFDLDAVNRILMG